MLRKRMWIFFFIMRKVVANIGLVSSKLGSIFGKKLPEKGPFDVKHIAVGSIITPGYFGLGDNVIISCVIKTIREIYPNAKITLITMEGEFKRAKWFFTEHSWVDNYIQSPEVLQGSPLEWIRFILRLRQEKFDMFLHQRQSLTPHYSWLIGVPIRVGFEGKPLTHKVEVGNADYKEVHWTISATAFLKLLGAPSDFNVLDQIPFIKYTPTEPVITNDDGPVIAIHPGGSKDWNRRWPEDSYVALCCRLYDRFNATFILIGGPEEKKDLERFVSKLHQHDSNIKAHLQCGAGLDEMISAITSSAVLICNDSGPQHLGVGLGTPVVSMYGHSPGNLMAPNVVDPEKHRTLFGKCEWPKCKETCAETIVFNDDAPDYPLCLKSITIDEMEKAACEILSAS